MATRKYHTLLTRDDIHSPWGIYFGDYDLEVVRDERADLVDGIPGIGHPKRNTKIITTHDAKQATIDAAVAKLNAGKGV